MVKSVAKDHSPAAVLDFQVKLRGVAQVDFDWHARQALMQDLSVERGLSGHVDRGHHGSAAYVGVITNVVAVHPHNRFETLCRTGEHHPHLAVRGKVQAARILLIDNAEGMALHLVLAHCPGLGVSQ